MQYTWSSGHQSGGMLATIDAIAARFYAEQSHLLVPGKRIEHADGIAASADTGHHHVWKPSRYAKDLLPGLASDHRLEVPNDFWIRMRTYGRSNEIICALHVGHPISHGFIDGVLEGPAAGLD